MARAVAIIAATLPSIAQLPPALCQTECAVVCAPDARFRDGSGTGINNEDGRSASRARCSTSERVRIAKPGYRSRFSKHQLAVRRLASRSILILVSNRWYIKATL